MLQISYGYDPRTREPRPLYSAQIAQIAYALRDRLLPRRRTYRVEPDLIIRCCTNAVVNFVPMSIQFHLDRIVRDEHGREILGATETRANLPGTVVVNINGNLIGDRDYLLRSTLAHELAHALFDGPAMLRMTGLQSRVSITHGENHLGNAGPRQRPDHWREFRANEFMGAFLVPKDLLHQETVRRAVALGVSLADGGDALPIIGPSASFDRKEHLLLDLAERFGVTPEFIERRLYRYALIEASASVRAA